MRRVVVTGMGIVSSIGNNTQEVLASLREAKSGIVRAEKYAELGFRCQVHGEPQLEWEAHGPAQGRAASWKPASAGTTSPWTRPSATPGSSRATSSTSAPASSWARAGPRRAPSCAPPTSTREKDPKKVGPFEVPKGMCSGPSAALATAFQIKGINYSISSACATSAHCIGNAAELIQWGKQDVMFAGGCEELDWTLSVLFDAMGAMSTELQRHAGQGEPRLRQEPRRLRHRRRRGRGGAGGAGARQGRGARIYGEVVGYGATSDGFDMVAPSGEGAARCMRMAHARASTARASARSTTSTRTAPARRSATSARSRRSARCSARTCRRSPSTKSLTGHSLGAVGVQEAIFSLLMMNNGFICESANIDELDPEFADVPIVRKRQDNAQP